MRMLAVALSFAALLSFASFVRAEDSGNKKAHSHAHTGKVVSVEKDALTVSFVNKKGEAKEHQVKIDSSTKITLDGKEAKLEDLKPGDQVSITAEHHKPATEVAATRTASGTGGAASAK